MCANFSGVIPGRASTRARCTSGGAETTAIASLFIFQFLWTWNDLLVGLAPADDAAVYKLDDERALVFTLDFFPPLVDDPALYGRIAATNALNDVFAMGGRVLFAMSIAAFPEERRAWLPRPIRNACR